MKVSLFKTMRSNKPKQIDLIDWLKSNVNPPKKLRKQIEEYRVSGDKRLKEGLPCITVSATFKGARNLKSIHKKTGLICLDVDRFAKGKKAAGNPCINMQLVKELLSSHPSCVYCGFSAGGDGVFAIIWFDGGKRLKEYWEHFRDRLALSGINIDSSCTDLTRLRYFSYDPKGYINEKPRVYSIQKKVKKKNHSRGSSAKRSEEKVEKIIEVITRTGIDITSDYSDWVKIAGALYSEFGDSGIKYFHDISKQHPEYSLKKCNRKFNQCKKMNNVSFASLFYIADGYGVRY